MLKRRLRNKNGKRNSRMKIVHDMMTLSSFTLGCDKKCPRVINTRHTMGSFNTDKLSPQIPQQSILEIHVVEYFGLSFKM